MNKKEYGLVLSGGGTRGAFQVGVWKALKELEVDVKAIAGTSIGALNGALILQEDFNLMVDLYSNIELKNIMEITEDIDTNKNLFDITNIGKVATSFINNKGKLVAATNINSSRLSLILFSSLPDVLNIR